MTYMDNMSEIMPETLCLRLLHKKARWRRWGPSTNRVVLWLWFPIVSRSTNGWVAANTTYVLCSPAARLSVLLTESSKAWSVMPHLCDITHPLTLLEKSRVVIPEAGFFLSSHRCIPLSCGGQMRETLMGLSGKIGPTAEKHCLEAA